MFIVLFCFKFVLSTVPDFDGQSVTKSIVMRYNFRSMVINMVRDKETLFKSKKITSNDIDANANVVCNSQTSTLKEQTAEASATPHDFLKGD